MPWMIEAAAIMSILVQDWVDFSIILVLLLFNAVLGFWHERQAASALDALKSALAQEAQALRTANGRPCWPRCLCPATSCASASVTWCGFFFQPPFPEWRLFCAIMGTQVFAALMAANGWLVTPISWGLIGFIWAYNLVWLLVVDVAKVALYRHYDTQETRQTTWQNWLHTPLDAFRGLHHK